MPVPRVVTFLKNNLTPDEQTKLSESIDIRKGSKKIRSLFSKFKTLVDMRDGFMHRAELVRIGNKGPYISLRRTRYGRAAGIQSILMGMNKLSELVKIAIIRYLSTPKNMRNPCMKHNII